MAKDGSAAAATTTTTAVQVGKYSTLFVCVLMKQQQQKEYKQIKV